MLCNPVLDHLRPVLWRGWLRITLALTGRLNRLRERLATSSRPTDEDSSLLWAAVAVVLTPDPESLLLIRRAERAGDPWSGHMALPGGRREPRDHDLLATAMRETSEEVGIALSPLNLVGTLEDVVPRTPVLPPIAVRPFVFLPPTRPQLVLNQEVFSARWVSLDELSNPGAHHPVHLQLGGLSREVQAYEIGDAIIWGMTERILTDLVGHLGPFAPMKLDIRRVLDES